MPAKPLTRRGALLGAGAALAGCAVLPDRDHDGPDAPRQQLTARPADARPIRTVWVLSSGGPRGFVHVGVIKALEELGHRPDMVVGGSVGSLIGALYAGGVRAAELERRALELGPTDMGRLAVTGEGRFAGTPLAEIVNQELQRRVGTREMQRLPVPFAAAVVERESRRSLLFNHGDAGVAVQASCAIEGLFTPVRIRGVQYVDADAVSPLPVRLALAWAAALNGPDSARPRVLALDASADETRAPPGAERYREADLRKRALTQADARHADLTLHPQMSYWVNTSREFRERTIAQGYSQTLAQAARIRAALT